jgi:hypothetical protein
MSTVNELLVSLNKLVADSNETLADQGAEMVSENAEWIDGEILNTIKSASSDSNSDLVNDNAGRLRALSEQANVSEQGAKTALQQIATETKQILDAGDGIADRRARIQAEREKVVANQKRSSELMSK